MSEVRTTTQQHRFETLKPEAILIDVDPVTQGGVKGVIHPGEKLWRMLQEDWFPKDSSGNRTTILEAAFIGQVSLMRAVLIDEHVVDGFPSGRFQNHGIVELDADEIVRRTGCTFEFDNSDAYWPTDSHVVLKRSSGGKNLRATHSEVRALTTIANSNASRIVREPK